MYTDFPPSTHADTLHAALFAGTIARFQELPEMQAVIAFTRASWRNGWRRTIR